MFAHGAGVPFTVTLVDDVSPEPMTEVYERAEELGCNVVYHQENKGFAGTCNTGARKGKSKLILLLNTDVQILHDGWLKGMTDEFDDPNVGVVGPLLQFFPEGHRLYAESQHRPPSKVQHAGVVFDVLGRPYHIFWGWSIDNPRVAQRREMNCVTGACLMTRRLLWRRLGGLDTDYTRGNFEDVQYCLQARWSKQKVVFTPEVKMFHYAGGSDNSMTASQNARLFQLKMGKFVEYDEWRFW